MMNEAERSEATTGDMMMNEAERSARGGGEKFGCAKSRSEDCDKAIIRGK